MLTPHGKHEKLGRFIGVNDLYFKREDLHPYGSHKGRSIPYMIDKYRTGGAERFALSSSGNAALAAGFHIQNYNRDFPDHPLSLSIFVGLHINPEKEAALNSKLTDPHIQIIKTERPKQALLESVKSGLVSLRQSTNDDALVGYYDLARELNDIPHLAAVFIGTSSGTTAEALMRAFEKIAPQAHVHIVQTSACPPIASIFDKNFEPEERSEADAIVDRVASRKLKIIDYIQKCKGSGWVVSNNEILTAKKLVKEKTGVDLTGNGALPVAGIIKAKKNGWHFAGAAVCIICGR